MATVKVYMENLPEAIEVDMDQRTAGKLAIHFSRKMAGEEYQSMFRATDADGNDCRFAIDMDKVIFVQANLGPAEEK